MAYPYGDFEKLHVLENWKRIIVSAPNIIRVQKEKLREEFGV